MQNLENISIEIYKNNFIGDFALLQITKNLKVYFIFTLHIIVKYKEIIHF